MKPMHVSARSKKATAVLASALVLAVALIGGSLAYLMTRTDPVVNTFTYQQIEITPEETIENGVKKDVKLSAVGSDVDSYVRADVVITWKDAHGNVAAQAPVQGVDYTITYGDDWTQTGGHWYYNQKLPGGKKTAPLIVACKRTGTPPEGYDLSVEILAQAVQAEPAQAVEDLWGMRFTGSGFVPVQ